LRIALVDYGAGNLHSAAKALQRGLGLAGLEGEVRIVTEAADVLAACRIVLPGDGAFRDCVEALRDRPGLVDALDRRVRRDGIPFLGICVGMQLLARVGTENGIVPGLGWLDGQIERIAPADPTLKVPHMGWNTLEKRRDHAALSGLAFGDAGQHAYFLHSFHYTAADPADVLAVADYGGPVTAIVGRGNILGTQFHPEKSQAFGLRLLANFLAWNP
jgi:imidazole glycerol-phosphate synthase subunit HisH